MRFIIANKPKEDTRVGYLLRINTMVGDADGYETIEVGTFCEDELHLLEEVIGVCDRMIEEYPHGRGGGDDYYHIEGFERWFVEHYGEDEHKQGEIEHLTEFSYPYSCDHDSSNTITGYKVVYLDNGLEYEVGIVAND